MKYNFCKVHHDPAIASGLFFMNSKLHGIYIATKYFNRK